MRRRAPAARAPQHEAVSSSTRSALLKTTISGMSRAPTSPITSRTVRSCAAGSGWDPSTTWTMTSASPTSSRRRAERLDELVGQVPHETDGVGEGVHAPVDRLAPAHRRVQRREQRVLDEDARARETVEQARLAGVGVPGDRDGGIVLRLRSARLASRAGAKSRSCLRSCAILVRMRRRSSSILVSPGPREPMPAPPAPTWPPA
jgi:hypothetical protein